VTPGRRLVIEKSDTTPPKTRSDTAQLATGDGTERQVKHQWMMERSWPSRTLGEAKDWTMMSHLLSVACFPGFLDGSIAVWTASLTLHREGEG
jgi:hypothetical protein